MFEPGTGNMWLDRLSSNSTVSGSPPAAAAANRPLSSASRRGTGLAASNSAPQRPSFNPRSSSLSLISNDSTASLLASSRRQNGSVLKQSSAVVRDAPDPLLVLAKLLGSEEGSAKARSSNRTDHTIESDFELDFDGLTLQEFVKILPFREEDAYKPQTVEECMYTNQMNLLPWF